MNTHGRPSAPPSQNGTVQSTPTPLCGSKRPHAQYAADADPDSSKRIKIEEPEAYSENVRRKLQATTRTGQACDRCKERKMKCDPDPVACQPCRQKNLKCFTTDRVSGQSRERGQSDRAENEVAYLRDQLAWYRRRYGPSYNDRPPTPHSAVFPSPSQERHPPGASQSQTPADLRKSSLVSDLPSPTYLGWPSSDALGAISKGPVEGTKADILDWGVMDSGAFDCDLTREPLNDDIDFFNFSTSSVLKTIHQRQRIHVHDLHLPSKAEALSMADTFLSVLYSYYPNVHKGSFLRLIHRLYDTPTDVSLPERIQVVQMLGVIGHQQAIRNLARADKINDSYRFFHYSLSHYPDLKKDSSLAAMQALTMILLQFRNMPKPGYAWTFAQELLLRCLDLDYHRDPDKLDLPADQRDPLSKELRKRVFHGVIGVCIATGCRLGRPAPWQFVHWDVPLPKTVLDSEIAVEGINAQPSGHCEFWPAIQLAKILPLYAELHNYVLSVRRDPADYLAIVDALQSKIDAWRADWDVSTTKEDKTNPHLIISTLLIDTWAAEFILNLHHPNVCTARTSDVLEKNLGICHKATKRMLSNFHTLSKQYKAADFTWHSIVAYTLGFGLTLHIHRRRTGSITQEQFMSMKNELAGWISLMLYADLVLKTDQYLQRRFIPLVEQVQKEVKEHVICDRKPEEHAGRPPFQAANGLANRTVSVKSEQPPCAPLDPRPPQELSAPPNDPSPPTQRQGFQQNHHPSYNRTPSYTQAVSSQSMPAYTVYGQTSIHYPPLPTSLAPLLNEAPPTTIAQYHHPSITVQDPAMMFAPHLYTDAAATWPVAPEGYVD